MITLPSTLHPEKRAYRLDRYSSDNFEKRGHAPLLDQLTVFETYGDGTTQHSGAWCVQWADLTDACLSMTNAILAEPKREEWQWLTSFAGHFSDAALRFALSVKYKETTPEKCKRQFFSLQEQKITLADKRNDRRYEIVQPVHDGTPKSALNIILADRSYNWLTRLAVAYRLREMLSDEGGAYYPWDKVFSPVSDLQGDWSQAFRAFFEAVKAVQSLDNATRLAECSLGNITRSESQKEAA